MASYSVATVRRGLRTRKGQPGALTTLGEICKAGAGCKQVQGSQVAACALADLNTAIATADTSLALVQAKELELEAALKALRRDAKLVGSTLSTYEAAVVTVSRGDATVVAAAGLKNAAKSPQLPLGKVTGVRTKQGKNLGEGVLSWPPAPGATSYALQLNFAPESATPSWIDGGTGTRRRRVVKGPQPGAQIQARVAAVAADGTRAEWSDTVLVTLK